MNLSATRYTLAFLLPACLFSLLSAQTIGIPDLTFGNKGQEWIALGAAQEINPVMTLQADQKILLAGSVQEDSVKGVAITRLLPNGRLDLTFAAAGRCFVPLTGKVNDIAVQQDGKVILAGYEFNGKNDDFVVVRITAEGKLDSSFNATGKKRVHLEGAEQAESVTIQPDGRIVLVGHTYDESWSERNFAIVRLNTDGSADASFGFRGRKMLDIARYDHAADVVVQPDGRILVAGHARAGTFNEFVAFRLDAQGKEDLSFGTKGIFRHHVGKEHDHCVGMVLEGDHIYLAGHTKTGGASRNFDFAVLALDKDGTLDPRFGMAGVELIDAGGVDYAADLLAQPDGRLLLVGSSSGKFTVSRLTGYGKPDPTFGKQGLSSFDMKGEHPDFATAACLQADGKILIAGSMGANVTLARLIGNPYLPGMEEVLAFDWKRPAAPSAVYASLSLMQGLAIQAWMPEKEQVPAAAVMRGGTQSVIPVHAAIEDYAYIALGKGHQVTMIWDLRGGIHYYLNGIYLKTELSGE